MKMKLVSLLFFSAISFSSLTWGATEENMQRMPAQQMQDGEALAWVSAIDNFEINAAEVAADKNTSDAVKEYVDALDHDHSVNLKQATDLGNQLNIKPVETKALNQFAEDGKAKLEKLDHTDKNFQKTFIDAMVAGHMEGLHKVDSLMKNVNNRDEKVFLHETRNMIIHHLNMAKALQKNMKTLS